jgi:hypothetical protein
MAVEAELKRRNQAGALVDWSLNDDGTEPVQDAAVLAKLQEISTILSGMKLSLIYIQGTVAAVWTIDHNLGYNPNAIVLDSTGTVVEGDTSYPTVNRMVITFSSGFSGRAFLS